MDANQFFIPKQTDESLVSALRAIRDEFKDFATFFILVNTHHYGHTVDIDAADPTKLVSYILSQNSQIMTSLNLIDSSIASNQQRTAVSISRRPGQIVDVVTIFWNEWAGLYPTEKRSQMFIRLMALARKHLRAVETEAGFDGQTDKEWTRYRDSQQAILNSLQETAKSVLLESNRRIQEAESEAKARHAKLESELRNQLEQERAALNEQHKARMQSIEERENAVVQRESAFNTKEARYVARQGQQRQIEDITKWLGDWSLTRGTTSKWRSVAVIYLIALAITLGMTIWFARQSFQLFEKTQMANLPWWQWTMLTVKPVLPFAAFITFLVYAIRWFSSWSSQHAEEEFRNRARLLDIGRSGWLLEAVRDAQENDRDLPPELLKELSRNLFAYQTSLNGSDLYPEALTEMFSEGITSLRLKHDGTEIEAKRGKEK